MKTKNSKKAVRLAPAAAVTTALLAPTTYGAAGDLDPSFGDLGRLGPILNGPAWSIEMQDDGSILLGGGDSYYYYGYYYWGGWETTNFVNLLSDTGVLDPAFVSGDLGNAQIFGVARQPDGAVVAVGRAVVNNNADSRLIVFRLLADGSLDPDFGDNGQYHPTIQDFGQSHEATSVVLDDDGRIVVAGMRVGNLIVLRLLPDGTLDDSFGSSGVFAGPAVVDYSPDHREGIRTNLLRSANGGYRVTASTQAGCQVVALGADGMVVTSFGTDGIATVDAPAGSPMYCNSMAEQGDGKLLVAGAAGSQGFAVRLLADGQPDPGFSGAAIAAGMSEATAIGVAGNGTVVVAGTSVDGLSIMRLQASGALDALFGQGGSATVDLQTDNPVAPVVRDLFIQADNAIVAAGGVDLHDWSHHRAFVARLLGSGGQSPGVLGITPQAVWQTGEGDGEVVLDVRRTGGSAGSVSVDWETALSGGYSLPPYYATSAAPDEDYMTVSGTLTWGDGDNSPQQIHVPVVSDATGEEPEAFRVVLTGSQGGAGLGQSGATVLIDADGGPYGQFAFVQDSYSSNEGGSARIDVSRNYYSTGPVSVTVTPVSGSAVAGDDFIADPVTLTWADGAMGWKTAVIPIVDDAADEQAEYFTVELSSPTGGAVVGPRWIANVAIHRSDPPPVGGSGGGALGWLSLLMLGALRLLRRTTARRMSRV